MHFHFTNLKESYHSDNNLPFLPKLTLITGDITALSVDAIVNSASPFLNIGGGVDHAIHNAAGNELLNEYIKIGGCKTGQAVLTKGYNLPSKHVIHTVAPVYGMERGKEHEILSDCYAHVLKLAIDNSIRSIAFPSIATGAFRFPIEEAALIALSTIIKSLKDKRSSIEEIIFVLHSEQDFDAYKKVFTDYLMKKDIKYS